MAAHSTRPRALSRDRLPPPRLEQMSLERRFWSKTKRVATGCWLWRGARTRDGRGVFRLDTRDRKGGKVLAARVAMLLARGAVPSGWECRHLCGHRDCVNPSHLDLAPRGAPRPEASVPPMTTVAALVAASRESST